uniref:Helicase-associated domain-containing protein n=1 Tax=Polyblepharides amylifera TaxID=1486889 RepID=A0A7R9XNB8_9CHLO|mmetsp:Transcript_34/g.44  ORF Transcript_34/g.44 Transcript_34/m.44 type:complete len:115 (+) Transcript_34:142-486(+)
MCGEDEGVEQLASGEWKKKFLVLHVYFKENGHCNVPRSHPCWNWCKAQRVAAKGTMFLKEDQKRALDRIGFEWTTPTKHVKSSSFSELFGCFGSPKLGSNSLSVKSIDQREVAI